MTAQLFAISHGGSHASGRGDLREELAKALEIKSMRLRDAALSTFETYDINRRTVLYFGRRVETPYCMLSVSAEGVLLGNAARREVPFKYSAVRSLGISIPPLLHCGALDALRIEYCGEDFGVIVDASYLLERIRFAR